MKNERTIQLLIALKRRADTTASRAEADTCRAKIARIELETGISATAAANAELMRNAIEISGGTTGVLTGMTRYDEQDRFWTWVYDQLYFAHWTEADPLAFITERFVEYSFLA